MTMPTVERAIATAGRDAAAATRELLIALFEGRRIAKPLGEVLSSIAERATALRMGTAPAGTGAAAESLGDNWFQCPHCADVFEGEKSKCPACGRSLAVARAALEIVLGDARMWLRETPPDPKHIGWIDVDWLRVEDGPRWLELFDDATSEAVTAAVTAKVALPPNVTAIGARDGGRTLFKHATKDDVYIVEGAAITPTGDKLGWTELAITHLAAVLFPDDVPAAPSGKALASKGHASEPQLEAAIAADPDRPEAYLVLADWLQAQGDPRGELIVLQHAEKALAAANLLERHAPHFFGRLADYRAMLDGGSLGRTTTWRWGFLESLWIGNRREHEGKAMDVDEALAAMLDHPTCRFLRELTVGIVTYEDNSYDDIAKVIGERELPHLRTLVLGDFDSEETELNWSHMGDVSPMYRAMPELRSLTLRSGSMRLGKIALPKLESLAIVTGGFDTKSLASICKAKWPALHTLDLQLGDETRFEIDQLAPILDARAFPKVTMLGLGNSSISDDICRALASSKIAAQLVGLNLSKGTMGDDGASALAKGLFPKLEWIDVSDNYLTDAGTAALAKLAKEVIVGDQEDDDGDPDNRYISARE